MIKLDYQTLAIVTSILYLTFTFVFLSLSRVLEEEQGLKCYAFFNMINFIGFSVIMMNPSIGVYSNLVNNIGTLCGSLFILEGACRLRGLGREKFRHRLFVGLGLLYICMSYLNMTNTTHRYLFHDAAIVIMYLAVAYIFIKGTKGKEKRYTMIISGSYLFLAIWFSIRWSMATMSIFTNEPLPKHPFLATIFFVVLLVSISSVVGILMLLIYRAHKDLVLQARVDELTGLANRKSLNEQLGLMLQSAVVDGCFYTVLLMDVNGFKMVNDTYGHSFGDKVLAKLAERLKATCFETDFVARMGGDEFVIICRRTSPICDLEEVKKRFRVAIEQAVIIDDLSVTIRVSIGGAHVPEECKTIDQVLLIADQAMYKEKESTHDITLVVDEVL